MKKVLSMIGLLLMIGMVVGCSDSSGNKEKESAASFDDIYADIEDKVKEDSGGDLGTFAELDLVEEESDDPFGEIYVEKMDLDMEKVENGRILAPLINTKSDEIILLEAKTEEDVDSIKGSLE